jgi:hypothetical protein
MSDTTVLTVQIADPGEKSTAEGRTVYERKVWPFEQWAKRMVQGSFEKRTELLCTSYRPGPGRITGLPGGGGMRDFDLVMLDVSASVAPGREREASIAAVAKVREVAPYAPILIVVNPNVAASRAEVEETVASLLDAGATDYLTNIEDALFRHRVTRMLDAFTPQHDEAAPSAVMPEAAKQPSLPADPFRRPWAELYAPETGRLDAKAVAKVLGIKLRPFMSAIGYDYGTAYKTPDAPALQPKLAPIARVLEMLHGSFQSPESVRAWLNTPRRDLEGDTPLQVILADETEAVVSLLEGAQLGVGG